MKIILKFSKVVFRIVLLVIILANLFILLSGRFYLYKGIANTYLKGRSGPSIYDRDAFYFNTIHASNSIFKWYKQDNSLKLNKKEEKFISSLKTESFILIKNDTIVFEKYWNNRQINTASNGFSATKTLVALLIGIAIEDGKINSLDDSVGKYLDEFNTKSKKSITIRHLLMMASGLDWEESAKNPLSENAASYYGSGINNLALHQKVIQKPGVNFNYQSGNSQLLGLILEKATGITLSKYAEQKIWSKIGTENDAYWTLDKENGDEKAFCCLYGTSRDFARLGRLILKEGKWEQKQIVPKWFMQEMFKCPNLQTEEKVANRRYGLHIWTYLDGKTKINYCRGILGQYIITIPSQNIIIIRSGFERLPNVEKSKNSNKIISEMIKKT